MTASMYMNLEHDEELYTEHQTDEQHKTEVLRNTFDEYDDVIKTYCEQRGVTSCNDFSCHEIAALLHGLDLSIETLFDQDEIYLEFTNYQLIMSIIEQAILLKEAPTHYDSEIMNNYFAYKNLDMTIEDLLL